ncbi:hypothetical protein FSP39_005392 [Pinctada imbricata]|uniref:Uncharacterized protein n=1 Tax=Pinctada imbricata TaxID=66713 RepID=A0AA88YRL5_PINIB|nr:hypothetical protein FSP39_005392 [Pinctada imbricata]
MANCLQIIAIICILITTVATIVSFATPNWLNFRINDSQQMTGRVCECFSNNCDCGLWLNCKSGATASGSLDNCLWFFADEFKIEKNLPEWFKAVQGLMSCAVASSMLALIIGLISLCWTCKGCNSNAATGAFANLTFLLLAVSVCVFGAKAYMSEEAEVITSKSVTESVILFGWSFWVAVGATGMSLIASILYFCVGRSDKYD